MKNREKRNGSPAALTMEELTQVIGGYDPSYVGGLVGSAPRDRTTVTGYNTGNVTSAPGHVGGLVGYNENRTTEKKDIEKNRE